MRKFQIEKADRGVIAYADMKIAKGEQETEYVKDMGTNNFVLGSGICLNLDYIDNMPAFYNPPEARGEDTFFSCSLREKNAQVLRVPTYHFHDSFLQFRGIMKEKYPEELSKVVVKDAETEKRFLKATIGWTRYKPLLYYINDRKEYKDIIEKTRENLNKSVYKMNTAFKNIDFSCLIEELDKYDKNVEKHYQEYLKVNKIWDDLKYKIKAD